MQDKAGPRDIIAELSGMDSSHRISSKYAAREILHSGQFLFDVVLDKALTGTDNAAVRCAKACARAAEENPDFAAKRSKNIISFILKKPSGGLRYFTASMLRHVKVSIHQSAKCAVLLEKWLSEEKGKGPRACYLEAVSSLAENNASLKPLAERLLNEALQSPVPSFSARARQIVLRMLKSSKKTGRKQRKKQKNMV